MDVASTVADTLKLRHMHSVQSILGEIMKDIPLKRCKPITYCKFCKALGIRRRCTVMTRYPPPCRIRDWYKHYACDEHKGLIEDPDPRGIMEAAAKNPAPPQKVARDDHYTEADYQTWMGL